MKKKNPVHILQYSSRIIKENTVLKLSKKPNSYPAVQQQNYQRKHSIKTIKETQFISCSTVAELSGKHRIKTIKKQFISCSTAVELSKRTSLYPAVHQQNCQKEPVNILQYSSRIIKENTKVQLKKPQFISCSKVVELIIKEKQFISRIMKKNKFISCRKIVE